MPPVEDNLSEYAYDEDVGRHLRVFLVIKGFKQLEIVKKIIERKGQRDFGLTSAANVSERKYSLGSIVAADLDAAAFTDETLADSPNRVTCLEPFGVAFHTGLAAYAAGYEIRLIDPATGESRALSDDWLSFVHTVEFSGDGRRVLASSAGFDTVLEIDVASGEVEWEWNAWDHGFNKSKVGDFYLTRNQPRADELSQEGRQVIFIGDPREWPKEGVPTQQSPTRLNGASYGPEGRVLTTFFHRSELAVVSRDGTFSLLDLGLSHPHGFAAASLPGHEGYVVTNTGAGEFLFLDGRFGITKRLIFSSLPADEEKKHRFGEWVQTVTVMDAARGILAAVDALRDGTHVIDLPKKRRRFIANPPEWTIQTVVSRPDGVRL